MGKNRALLELGQLSARNATGELVVTHDATKAPFEIHVFIRLGRVAWATNSNAENVLLADLTERCGIDREALQEVVADCQRTGQSLGGTLVDWGLASLDDVHAALLRHVRSALEPLIGHESCDWVFLERRGGYATYDARLTFGLEELIPERNWKLHTPAFGIRPPIAERISRCLPDANSVRMVRAESGEQGVRLAAQAGADFFAARGQAELAVGLQVQDTQWVVISAAQHVTLVAILQALSECVRSPLSPAVPQKARGSVRPFPPADPSVAPLLERFDDLEAIALVGADGDGTGPRPPCAACRGGLSPEEFLAVARSCEPLLDGATWRLSATCSVLLGRGGLWILGTRIPHSPRTIWIAIKRNRSQALGWSILASLSRREAPSGP